MTLIICESLREIGEVACVTSAWSSRGQTLNIINPVDKTKLSCYSPHRRSTIVSLDTYPSKADMAPPILKGSVTNDGIDRQKWHRPSKMAPSP